MNELVKNKKPEHLHARARHYIVLSFLINNQRLGKTIPFAGMTHESCCFIMATIKHHVTKVDEVF